MQIWQLGRLDPSQMHTAGNEDESRMKPVSQVLQVIDPHTEKQSIHFGIRVLHGSQVVGLTSENFSKNPVLH